MSMKKMAFILALLCSVCVLWTVAIAGNVGDSTSEYGFVNNPNSEDRLNLRITPEGKSIGKYYNGTPVEVKERDGEWMQVVIGQDGGSISGYMKTEFIFQGGVTNIQCAIAVGVVYTTNETYVDLKSEPSKSSMTIGQYVNGAKVEILGDLDGWHHVRLGDHTGFLPSDNLVRSELIISDAYAGIMEIGYAKTTLPSGMSWENYGNATLYAFPSENANTILDVPGEDGSTFQLIANLGDWVQVRNWNESQHGFMKSDILKILNTDEWVLSATDQVIVAGSYQIGQDISPGLYTVSVAASTNGNISIQGSGTEYDHEFNMAGPASYTIYLPDKGEVVFTGGTMSPMTLGSQIIFDDILSGNGMYWVKNQFPRFSSESFSTYRFTLKPDAVSGYVKAYNAYGILVEQAEFSKDGVNTTTDIPVGSFYFIEMNNCVMTIENEING